MSRLRKRGIRREIRRLQNLAMAQLAIVGDESSTRDQKFEAIQRLAEIRLRIQVLHEEFQGL